MNLASLIQIASHRYRFCLLRLIFDNEILINMLVESSRRSYRWFLILIPIVLAIAIYPLPFDGKQVISIDAPIQTTFDVLVKNVWHLHPSVLNIKKLDQINDTTTFYQITNHLSAGVVSYVDFSFRYYVVMNIEREKSCLTSEVETSWKIMKAFHQYCLHTNTLKPTTTIITDQFHGHSWMMFMSYIRMKMLQSHKNTLEKLRKEMMIYSID